MIEKIEFIFCGELIDFSNIGLIDLEDKDEDKDENFNYELIIDIIGDLNKEENI